MYYVFILQPQYLIDEEPPDITKIILAYFDAVVMLPGDDSNDMQGQDEDF